MNILVCLHSPKLTIPNYPARWRVINTLIFQGSFLEMFALSMCIGVFSFAFMSFYSWKTVKRKIDERHKET